MYKWIQRLDITVIPYHRCPVTGPQFLIHIKMEMNCRWKEIIRHLESKSHMVSTILAHTN